MDTILITGGIGFIGSNFIPYYLNTNPDGHIVNLDKLTYAGDFSNLSEIEGAKRYTFIKGDICDTNLVKDIFKSHNIKGVIHFAAESHVDNSILNPDEFVKTNVLGTLNLLNQAKNYWMISPFKYKKGFEKCRFVHISTDEVYGSLGKEGFFTEETPYAPNSPYSASKASSDMMVRSYFHTYGMNVITTNCSNNYGAKQHDEKLIPTIIRKAISKAPIPIYGTGENIRDWLYVLDHCKAISLAYSKGYYGETYNIGGHNEKNNLEVARTICHILDEIKPKSDGSSYTSQIKFVKDRPGHDFRYAIDPTKSENDLGWKANETFESGIKKTVAWYLKKYNT